MDKFVLKNVLELPPEHKDNWESLQKVLLEFYQNLKKIAMGNVKKVKSSGAVRTCVMWCTSPPLGRQLFSRYSGYKFPISDLVI